MPVPIFSPHYAARRQLCELIRSNGAPSADLAALAPAAAREGVSGLLLPLSAAFAPGADAFRFVSIKAGRLTRRAVDLLDGQNIPCVVLKGVAIAARAWADPSLRPQTDVDLLVAPRDFARARDAIVTEGLAQSPTIPGVHYHHATLPAAPGEVSFVELHHELSGNLPLSIETGDLLSRRARVDSAVGPLPALAVEDDAVYLALHASNHALERLSWLADLAGLAERQRLDWVDAAHRARAWRAALPTWVAWHAAREWLGARIPDAALEALGRSRLRTQTAEWLVDAAGRVSDPWSLALARVFRAWLLPDLRFAPAWLVRKLRARAEERAAATPSGGGE